MPFTKLDYQLITPTGVQEATGAEDLDSLQPVVLVGSDGSPYRFSRMFDSDIPSAEGWLLGVQAVWGAWISHAGTLGVTLIPRQESGVATRVVWLTEQQLQYLQEALSDHQLRALQSCRWSSHSESLVIENPQVLSCFAAPLAVEGELAVVSSVVHTASHNRTLTAAETLVWLADYALANGFAPTSPEQISNPQNRQDVQQMLDHLALPPESAAS